MTKKDCSYIALDSLNEANQIEHFVKYLVLGRINRFEKWLIQNSYSISDDLTPTFIIFGHAQYFKYLLNKSEEMRNCDIWKVTASINQENKIIWNNFNLKYRSPFSYNHPIQVFKTFWLSKLIASENENNKTNQTKNK